MIDIRQEGHSQRSAPQKRHMALLRRHACCTPRKPSSWDGGGYKSQPSTAGDCVHQAPGNLSSSDLGWAQNTGPTKHAPLWSTREPGPEWLRPGNAYNLGPASDSSQQSNLESEQCRLGKHTCCEWGQTQCSWHMPVIFVCSVPPSAQHD